MFEQLKDVLETDTDCIAQLSVLPLLTSAAVIVAAPLTSVTVTFLHLATGNSLSLMIMVCVQVAALFDGSLAVHKIVVVPTGNGAVSASASLRTPLTVTVPLLSVAVAGTMVSNLEHKPAPFAEVIFAGQVITGGTLSITAKVIFL